MRPVLPPGVAKPHYLASDVAAYVMAWNTKLVSADAAPRSWKEFWDVARLPGKRGLWKRAPQTLEVALMADGVEPRNLYPLDVDRAFRSHSVNRLITGVPLTAHQSKSWNTEVFEFCGAFGRPASSLGSMRSNALTFTGPYGSSVAQTAWYFA